MPGSKSISSGIARSTRQPQGHQLKGGGCLTVCVCACVRACVRVWCRPCCPLLHMLPRFMATRLPWWVTGCTPHIPHNYHPALAAPSPPAHPAASCHPATHLPWQLLPHLRTRQHPATQPSTHPPAPAAPPPAPPSPPAPPAAPPPPAPAGAPPPGAAARWPRPPRASAA